MNSLVTHRRGRKLGSQSNFLKSIINTLHSIIRKFQKFITFCVEIRVTTFLRLRVPESSRLRGRLYTSDSLVAAATWSAVSFRRHTKLSLGRRVQATPASRGREVAGKCKWPPYWCHDWLRGCSSDPHGAPTILLEHTGPPTKLILPPNMLADPLITLSSPPEASAEPPT